MSLWGLDSFFLFIWVDKLSYWLTKGFFLPIDFSKLARELKAKFSWLVATKRFLGSFFPLSLVKVGQKMKVSFIYIINILTFLLKVSSFQNVWSSFLFYFFQRSDLIKKKFQARKILAFYLASLFFSQVSMTWKHWWYHKVFDF